MSIKYTAAAVLLSVMTMAPVMAAEQKLAVVNVAAIVQQLPQMEAGMEAIRAEFAADIEKVKKLETDIAYNMEKQKRDTLTMSDAEKTELVKTINVQRRQYTELGQQLDAALRQRQGEERNKVLALVKQAVDGIAAKEGYDAVFSAQAMVYVKPEHDISAKVVEQLSKLN